MRENLYTENCRLLREIKEDLNKWGDTPLY